MIQNILIVGAGDIGSHIAGAIIEQVSLLQDYSREKNFKLFIHNRTHQLAQQTVADLSAKLANQQINISVILASEAELDILIHIVDLIFYTAGVGVAATQKQGLISNSSIARDANIQDNLEISEKFCSKLRKSTNQPYIIISANPAETLIRHFCQLTDIPSTKILGCGLRVDELRMNYFTTEMLNHQFSSKHQVSTKCLGFHSATGMVFPRNFIEINGRPLDQFEAISANKLDQLLLDAAEKTKHEGISHVLIVGRSAYWAHAQAAGEIFTALVKNDQASLHSMTVFFRDFEQTDYRQFFIADAMRNNIIDYCLGLPVRLTQDGARIDATILQQLSVKTELLTPDLSDTALEALIALSTQEISRSTAALNIRRDFSLAIEEAKEYLPMYPRMTEPDEVEAAADLYNKGQLVQAKQEFQRIKSNSASNEFRLRINLSLGVILTMLHENSGPNGAIALYQASLRLWLDVNNETKDCEEYQTLSATLDFLAKLKDDQILLHKSERISTSSSQPMSDSAVILMWAKQLNEQDSGCYKINKPLPAHHAYSKVRILNNVGILCLALGQLDKAAVLFHLVRVSEVSSSFYIHAASQNAALVDARKGEYAQSLRKLDVTRQEMLDKNDPLLTASTYNAYGLVNYATGYFADAKTSFLTCLNVLNSNATIKNSLTNIYIAYAFLNLAKTNARMMTDQSPVSEIEQTMRYLHCSFNIFTENSVRYPDEQIFEIMKHCI